MGETVFNWPGKRMTAHTSLRVWSSAPIVYGILSEMSSPAPRRQSAINKGLLCVASS
jgi:hypothetical protein